MYNIQNDFKKWVKLIVGPLALPKKDKIDPWHLAMLDLLIVK
jgi:hypothetical protein